MKSLSRTVRTWILILTSILFLAGCQTAAVTTGEQPVPQQRLHTCYALSIQNLPLDTQRRWLRLLPDGQGVLFIAEVQEPGTWTLEGDAFLFTPANGGPEAEGTWKEGVLTLTIGEMEGIFVREGVPYPLEDAQESSSDPVPSEEGAEAPDTESEEDVLPQAPHLPQAETQQPSAASQEDPPTDGQGDAPEEDLNSVSTYPCYEGLYYVDYNPQIFTPGPVGGPDLTKEDGTQLWLARIETRDLTDLWMAGMEEKRSYPQYLSFEDFSDTVAGYPLRAIVYQDEKLWHAEALMDLGEDKGTSSLPLYAVYLTCSGPTRQSVWDDGMEDILPTLRLGDLED